MRRDDARIAAVGDARALHLRMLHQRLSRQSNWRCNRLLSWLRGCTQELLRK